MTKPLKQLEYGFTKAIRINWATGDMALPASPCWPSRNTYQSLANQLPTYKKYSTDDCKWDDGEFILDLTKFTPSLRTSHEYNFALIGCQGANASVRTNDNGVIQQHIGNLVSNPDLSPGQTQIGRLHVGENRRPVNYDFKLFAGDNAYDFGVTSPTSPYFKNAFGQYYTQSPNFVINGNHDWNFHGNARWTPYNLTHSSLYRAMCQVYHSYIKADHTYSWHMPYLYYALTSPLVNFICIDSNTIIFDKAQQIWLNDIYKKLKQQDKWLILVSHHPLEYYGPRRNKRKSEWKKYQQKGNGYDFNLPKIYKFKPQGENEIDAKDINTIGAILQRCIEENEYQFDAIFCAHEHAMVQSSVALQFASEVKKRSILQIISGGGGAALNDVNRGKNDETVIHHCQKEHGYAAVKITADAMVVHNRYVRKTRQAFWPCMPKPIESLEAFEKNIVQISKRSKDLPPAELVAV